MNDEPARPLDRFLAEYADFEEQVRETMDALFGADCALCTACCCRADICEEVLLSPFLSRLLDRQGFDERDFDDRYGWLDTGGCRLRCGRPPVCYAFFCGDLLGKAPDDEGRYVIEVLGMLMDFVGREALDGTDLCEIRDPAALARLDFEALSARLAIARRALAAVHAYLQSWRMTPPVRDALAAIPLREI